jgi:hypothetical protein
MFSSSATAARAATAGVLAFAAVVLSACDHNAAPAPGSAPAATPLRPAASTGTHRYQSTTNACALLDLHRLIARLGPDAGDLGTPQGTANEGGEFVRCEHQFGVPKRRSLVDLQVMTDATGKAAAFYDGLRAVHSKEYRLSDVAGLAHGAYTYTDPSTGPHLVLVDGNLYLTIWIQTTPATADPAELTGLMVDCARYAMTSLAAS